MPPLPVIPGGARAVIKGICPNGQPFANVLAMKMADGLAWDTTGFSDLLASVQKLYQQTGYGTGTRGWANYAKNTASTLTLDIELLDGVTPATTLPLVIAGAGTGEALTDQSALIISHRTYARGRSYRGRTYWGGFDTDASDTAGQVDASIVPFIEGNWAAFRNELAAYARSIQFGILSETLGTINPVLGSIVRLYFGHQDRRRR